MKRIMPSVAHSSVVMCMAFCAALSYMIISVHYSLRMDLHTSLGRMEQQLEAVQAHLDSQQAMLMSQSTDTRLQLAQMAMNTFVRSIQLPEDVSHESVSDAESEEVIESD
jgi:hypothetical protein